MQISFHLGNRERERVNESEMREGGREGGRGERERERGREIVCVRCMRGYVWVLVNEAWERFT